ncbi:MAG: DUF1343 domain-containing protein, partial [Bryobacteraceae bacterium]
PHNNATPQCFRKCFSIAVLAIAAAAGGRSAEPGRSAKPHDTPVLTGLDVLAAENFAPLKGKNVGLITNHTGLSVDGKRNVDLMLAAGIHVLALFSPEHGILGVEDQPNIADSTDKATGLPVRSLHDGKTHRMTPEMLTGIDTLVYDIQDVGARFYTYSCTMIYGMQEAARNHVAFYVLDRPNPITGSHVEGPMIDSGLKSYVGCADEPVRHGFTFGELARYVNGESAQGGAASFDATGITLPPRSVVRGFPERETHLGADLHVIPMRGWRRGMWWDETNLTWVDPSPNMNSLPAAVLYPGTCLLESSKNFSVGRGTRVAYEQVGADWVDGRKLAAYLNARAIPGVRAYPTRFRPTASHFQGRQIEGVRFVITDRDALDSVRLGLEIIHALQVLYPGKLSIQANQRLIGSKAVIDALEAGADPLAIERSFHADLEKFLKTRQKYLLYSR